MDDAHGATTEQFPRRTAALRRLAHQRGARVTGSPAFVEAVRAFGTERDLLLAVHQRWQVHLLARLDQVIELGGDDVHEEVRRAVAELGRVMPGLAAVLREHAADPVLAVAQRRLAAYVDQACPCGRAHPLVPAAPRRRTSRCALRRALVRAAHRCERLHERPVWGVVLVAGHR